MDNEVLINIPVWGIAIIPVLIVISIFVIILITLNIEKTREPNLKKNEGKQEWVGKRDILYWLLIVCLGSISMITYEYRNYEQVISHWGFAGTIVSIILAVVAIGFTLFQTLTHSLSSEKIEESAGRIEKASAELDSTKLEQASEIITNTSKNIAEFNTNVEVRLKEMTEEITTMKDAHLNYNNRIDALFFNKEENEFEGNENGNQSGKSLNIDIDNFIEKEFSRLAKLPRIFLYCIFWLSEKDILLNKQDRNTLITKVTDLQIQISLEVEDEDKYKKQIRRIQLMGANFGSLGAVRTLVNRLGILKAYREKDEQSRMTLLKKAGESIPNEYKELLEKLQFNGSVNQ